LLADEARAQGSWTNQQKFAFGLLPDSGASVNPFVSPLNKTTGLFTLTNWIPFTPDSVVMNGGGPIEEVTVDVPRVA